MFDGDPDLGKSLVTLDLCARLSTGRPFPDGSPSPGPANALVLNGEDSGEDTVRPRLQALGADLDRVFVYRCDDPDADGLLRLPRHWQQLHHDLTRTGARLLVIDPIMAFLDSCVMTGNDQSLRQALFPLARSAELHECAVLLVRHLNKQSGGRSLYRGSGSIAFQAACRSGWLVARDPHAPAQCVLAQVKNNLAPPQPSLAYCVQEQEKASPLLSWLGPHPLTADQLLAGTHSRPASRPIHRARAFLRAFLARGPRTTRDIWAAARERGFTRATLDRAKGQLEIRAQWTSRDGRPVSYWLLPAQKLPLDPTLPDLEPWLAPLREQFPSPTPLDDL
jgi:hypothetical protein